jgi:hypothetical protein
LLFFNLCSRIQRLCITAAYLSSKLFVTYFDVSIDPTLTPLDILRGALRARGIPDQFDNIESLVGHLRKEGLILFTIFDEAEKYFIRHNVENPVLIDISLRAVRELYLLGNERGSTVLLCGSSSKLADLALQRTSTDTAKSLMADYHPYASLNNQKYSPMTLPLVELDDVAGYLEVCTFIFHLLISKVWNQNLDEDAIKQLWLKSGGSLRYMKHNETYPPVEISLDV